MQSHFERLVQSGAAATWGGWWNSREQAAIFAGLCVEQDLQGCVGGHEGDVLTRPVGAAVHQPLVVTTCRAAWPEQHAV